MKSLIIGALALSLLAAGVGAAQPMVAASQTVPVSADHNRMTGGLHEAWHHRHIGRRVCIWRHHHQICYWRDR